MIQSFKGEDVMEGSEVKPQLCECGNCGSTEFCVEEQYGVKYVICRNCDVTYGEVAIGISK
jgi:hypothetical protein